MALASRIAKMFSKSEVKKMDEAAKKAAGSPGYDDDTIAAQKEFLKEKDVEKSKKLTKKEEAAADREAYASAMGKEKPAGKKGPLTEKEKKELQKSLELKKGGYVTKMAKGGCSTKKMNMGGMANCGASMKPAQKAKK
jgi:hypothetical protein